MTSVHLMEELSAALFIQLIIILFMARVGGSLAVCWGQTFVVGEIIIGVLLGPSLFGKIFPDIFNQIFRSTDPAPMQMLSQLGLLLLMFQIGLEFNFQHLRQERFKKLVLHIAPVSLVLPFLLGLGLGHWAAQELAPQSGSQFATTLFIATAFSITALPVLGRILLESRLEHTPLGVIAISIAAVNDVVGWVLLALVTALTLAQLQWGLFALNFLLIAGFVGLCWWLVRPLLKKIIQRWSQQDPLNNQLLALLLGTVLLAGLVTQKLGIFTIFGGFVVGVLLHDEHRLVAAWKERMGHFVKVFFLPIFFAYTGLRTDIGSLNTPSLWGWCLLVVVLATLGKFGGTYLMARWCRCSRSESKILGALINTRGLMELIVLNVGLDLGVLSASLFTMLVLMAIISTVITVPLLRHWLPHLQGANNTLAPVVAQKI